MDEKGGQKQEHLTEQMLLVLEGGREGRREFRLGGRAEGREGEGMPGERGTCDATVLAGWRAGEREGMLCLGFGRSGGRGGLP